MGYAEYLKNLLRPLRLYELNEGAGAAELSALGAGLDALSAELDSAEAESVIPTASGAGLKSYEDILPYTPSYITLADRRRAIMALLRIDGRAFTPAALNDTLSGCGLRAVAEETASANTVLIYFPENRGQPDDYAELKRKIEQILPCHLGVEYKIIYITWAEVESFFASWSALEAACPTWDALEKYAGPGV
ncbi:MAG: DUF2313 domain-containing protein [Oscillospiraceae bacterium]